MEVAFRNKKMMAKFDEVRETFERYMIEDGYDMDDPKDLSIHHSQDVIDQPPEVVLAMASEEELRTKYLPNWREHIGYPTSTRVIPVEQFRGGDPKWEDLWDWGKNRMVLDLGVSSNALFVHYPPNGLTGWHTNWNANAYQVLFTWSETGDGFFTYYDIQQDKVVTIQDKPGWQCRWYYFGRKDEPQHHCWHACYSGKSRRMTLAFKFSNKGIDHESNEMAEFLRDEFIAEIETDE